MSAAAVLVDLGPLLGVGGDGVHWTLAEPGDMNVNVVHLDPGQEIVEHRNDEVDVVFVFLAGAGDLVVDGDVRELGSPALAHVRRGARRGVRARSTGLTYVTVHRRRGPLDLSGPAR